MLKEQLLTYLLCCLKHDQTFLRYFVITILHTKAREMAHQVKALVAKTYDLRAISTDYMVEEED